MFKDFTNRLKYYIPTFLFGFVVGYIVKLFGSAIFSALYMALANVFLIGNLFYYSSISQLETYKKKSLIYSLMVAAFGIGFAVVSRILQN